MGVKITAGATAAGTQATISAANAGMNADGNLLRSLDDVGKTTIKETTSKESLRNIAISAALLYLLRWQVLQIR